MNFPLFCFFFLSFFLQFLFFRFSPLSSGPSEPMVCVRVAFHENDGDDEHDENEDDADSYKQRVECWIRGNHGNNGNDENHENPGCKPRVPQTTGLEIPEKRRMFMNTPSFLI